MIVEDWDAAYVKALRDAMRLSVKDFAAVLGVSSRAVIVWQSATGTRPRWDSRAMLDELLARQPQDVVARFEAFASGLSLPVTVAPSMDLISTAADMALLRAHQPRRPLWNCAGCGGVWPCGAQRRHLLDSYCESVILLRQIMGFYFVESATDLPDTSAGVLHQRFIGWIDTSSMPRSAAGDMLPVSVASRGGAR